ncbi:LexA family protein [Patescibacteria group bacterium]
MHEIQKKLLKTIEKQNLSKMPLRAIGEVVGVKSAQKIKHHLLQLQKKGFIVYNPVKRQIKKTQLISKEGLVSIPIIGSANCGPATIFAEPNVEGYLKISRKLSPSNSGKLYILRAEGNSMNRANINNKNIEDGDFVVVDSEQKTPESGQYVISVIDGAANIKRFISDHGNNRIVLKSESTQDYLPIFIHEDDQYNLSGRVIDVIKK